MPARIDEAKQQKILVLLATGLSLQKVADEVGVGTATVSRIKKSHGSPSVRRESPKLSRPQKEARLAASAASAAASLSKPVAKDNLARALAEDRLTQTLAEIPFREAEIVREARIVRDKLYELVLGVVENTSLEDISPRQMPGMLKALTDLTTAELDWTAHLSGVSVLAEAYRKHLIAKDAG